MFNKNNSNGNSLNNTIGTIIVFILCIALAYTIISSIIMWEETSKLVYIISGVIGIIGISINIFFFSREIKKK